MRRTNSSSNLVILMFLVEQNVLVEDKVTNRVGYCGNACNKVKGGTSKIQDIIVLAYSQNLLFMITSPLAILS